MHVLTVFDLLTRIQSSLRRNNDCPRVNDERRDSLLDRS